MGSPSYSDEVLEEQEKELIEEQNKVADELVEKILNDEKKGL